MDEDKEKLKSICHSIKKFFLRYVLLMIFWIGALFLSVEALHMYRRNDEKFYYVKKIIGRGLYASQITGIIINFNTILIILPVCRSFNKLIHKLLSRISPHLLAVYLEKLKVVHQFFALTLIYLSFLHIAVDFTNAINFIKNHDSKHPDINWAKGRDDNIFRLIFLTPVGFSGWTMLACIIIMWIFSTRQMRTYFYNSFLGVHHIFILFYIMMFYHPMSDIIKYQENVEASPPSCDINWIEDAYVDVGEVHSVHLSRNQCDVKPEFTAGSKNFWIYPTIALSIFFIDHLLRYFRRFFIQVKPIEMKFPTRNAMFLTFKVNDKISIQPGSYVLLQCENISTLEWHPFYITDYFIQPGQTIFTLAIAIRGDWTRELYDKAFDLKIHTEKIRKRKSSSGRGRRHRGSSMPRKLVFVMDGPFPNQAESILAAERIVMIASGIGVTPYISIFNYIMKTTEPSQCLKRIHFVWMARDIKQFTLFARTLCDLTQMFWNENQPDKMQIRFYLTKNTKRRQSVIFDDISEDEYMMRPPRELFGQHTDFVMSRMYVDNPNWDFLFYYWTTLYDRKPITVYSCGSKMLNKDVKKACCHYNKKGYNFRYIHEAFN